MNVFRVIGLSIINGLFFALPYLFDAAVPTIFFALAFLFFFQEKCLNHFHKLIYLIICTSIWMFVILYWLHHDDSISFWSTNIIIIYSIIIIFLFLFVFFFFIVRLRVDVKWKYLVFTILWVIFELYHTEQQIRYPLFSLGLVLGNFPPIIQWYSFTGIVGGSLWILLVNFVVLEVVKQKRFFLNSYLLFLLPIVLSLTMFVSIKYNNHNKLNVAACSLNIEEKNKFDRSFCLVESVIDSTTNLVFCPEGLLHLSSTSFPINTYFSKIKRLLKSESNRASYIFGSSSNAIGNNKLLDSVRYNMAIQCDTSGFVNVRNKILLVPFGEFIPYEKYLGEFEFIRKVVNTSLSSDHVFDNIFRYNEVEILPLICYELFFSNFIRRYFKENSIGLICCISNEYSVPNKTYYTPFNRMSIIQAISFRTPIVKSTINGHSAIISQKGNIILSNYNKDEVIKGGISIMPEKTFYAQNGYLAITLILLFSFVVLILKRP